MKYILVALMFLVACAIVPSVESVDNDYANSPLHSGGMAHLDGQRESVVSLQDKDVPDMVGEIVEVSVHSLFARLNADEDEEEGVSLS